MKTLCAVVHFYRVKYNLRFTVQWVMWLFSEQIFVTYTLHPAPQVRVAYQPYYISYSTQKPPQRTAVMALEKDQP